ncbi:MAG: DNA double-strand break repair nuclease NurA [Candidatus Thermoplasmatota archaeon]
MKIDEILEALAGADNFEVDKDNFIEFFRKNNCTAYSIDGSSVKILDAYSFSIFARRFGYNKANEKNIIERKIGEIELDVIYGENADAENDLMREKEEYKIAKEIAGNEIVIFDGCLKYKLEGIVGISKKSGYKKEKIPILFAIKKVGEKIMKEKCWYYKIENGIYAVKFNPYSKFIFRVDYFGKYPEEIFSEISALCKDISCLGYPYCLADIHRHVKISKDEENYLKHLIQKKAFEKGISNEEWESIFYDYHEYIEG